MLVDFNFSVGLKLSLLMGRILILRETERSVEDLARRFDRYLIQARETITPFDEVADYSWNSHRNRVTIRGGHFHAEVVLMPKRVMVIADIPMLWFPFKNKIEERITHALDSIIANGEVL